MFRNGARSTASVSLTGLQSWLKCLTIMLQVKGVHDDVDVSRWACQTRCLDILDRKVVAAATEGHTSG
eukprot:1761576-Pyramimonas_sp.AAC.1